MISIIQCSYCGNLLYRWYSKILGDRSYCNHICLGKKYKNIKRTTQVKERISKKLMNHRRSKESRLKQSRTVSGKNNHNFGKPRDIITRQKISKGLTGKIQSKEHIEKCRLKKIGRKHTELTRLKMSLATDNREMPTSNTKPEKMMQIGLSLEGIHYTKNKKIRGRPDIFIEPNICLFIDGDYWHGNPKKYNHNSLIIGKKKAGDVWAKDMRINNYLTQKGFHVIRLWESDILKNVKSCADNVLHMIKEINSFNQSIKNHF